MNLWKRAKDELAYLVELADNAMREANNDGGEYDRNEILADARAMLAEMEKAECVDGIAAPAGDPARYRWTVFGGRVRAYEDERPALLLLLEEDR